MAKPGRIDLVYSEWSDSGITVQYVKRRNMLDISGWYDGCVGIEGGQLTLRQFFDRLGITKKDIDKAWNEEATTNDA